MDRDVASKLNPEVRPLSDAIITLDDGHTFTVERSMLAACSPYFRALFTNGMNETRQLEISIPDVPSDTMRIIIGYAHTRHTDVTVDNVKMLITISDRLNVSGVVKACCAFMARNLDADNCISIKEFTRRYFFPELERRAQQYIFRNFQEVATHSSDILNMSKDEVIALFSSDYINVGTVGNEAIVFQSILRWICHELSTRRCFLVDLMKTVRFGLLTTKYFVKTVMVHPLIRNNLSCSLFINETLMFLYDRDNHGHPPDLVHPLSRLRIHPDVLFIFGGWKQGRCTNTMETYDTLADEWRTCSTPDIGPRAQHGCATVDGLIYVIGGFDGTTYLSSVQCYNPVGKTWHTVAPMHSPRNFVSVAVLDGCIYVMGGFDGYACLKTAEKYSPEKNQWTHLPVMHDNRSNASATTLNGKIFIAGGWKGSSLRSAEYFNPKTNRWEKVRAMRRKRSGLGVIAHSGYAYAVGGFDDNDKLRTAERYNPVTNVWSRISDMSSPRVHFGIEVINNRLIVIGGNIAYWKTSTVELYDEDTNKWSECASIVSPRNALSTVVLKDLPNVTDYIDRHKEKRNDI